MLKAHSYTLLSSMLVEIFSASAFITSKDASPVALAIVVLTLLHMEFDLIEARKSFHAHVSSFAVQIYGLFPAYATEAFINPPSSMILKW